MSDGFTLTEVELREWTGAVRKSRQRDWLLERKIPFQVGADGKVKVARHVAEAAMGVTGARTRTPRGPNLDALRKAS
jgi:hypothetical protein